MTVREISTTAVDRYLRLLRVPLDAAINRLPGNGTGAAPTARLAVDRADASLRALLSSMLGDASLSEDAEQRRRAAEARERAMRLRTEAEHTTDRADARLQERETLAERQRTHAKERARTQRQRAQQKRKQDTASAVQAQSKRTKASRDVKARADEAVGQRAPKARLESLDAGAEALHKKKQALTASDEARRLRDAAGDAKAQRKNANNN